MRNVIVEPRTRTRAATPAAAARPFIAPAPASRLPEPPEERLRGPKLIALWSGLIVGSWVVVGGAGYGLYLVVAALVG